MQLLAFAASPAFLRRSLFGFLGHGLGDLDDPVNLFGCETTHFHEDIRLDHRQIVVREITLFNQALSDFFGDTIDLAEAGHSAFDLIFQFRAGHDFDIPPTQLAGQADVLTTASDRERELVFLDQHNRTTDHVTQQNLFDFGWLQRIGDQYFRIVAETNHVNVLARQFFADGFDSAAAVTHTDCDRIDLRIDAADGNLATVARFAADRLDRDDFLSEFRDLLLEQSLHQLGTRAAEDYTNSITGCTNLEHHGANPFPRVKGFPRNLFAARQDRFDVS